MKKVSSLSMDTLNHCGKRRMLFEKLFSKTVFAWIGEKIVKKGVRILQMLKRVRLKSVKGNL